MEQKNLSARVRANITKYRLAKGYSQRRLGKEAGLSVSLISLIERGKRGVRLENLERIAEALEVDPIVLLREDIEQ